ACAGDVARQVATRRAGIGGSAGRLQRLGVLQLRLGAGDGRVLASRRNVLVGSPGPSPRGGGVKRGDASSPGPSPHGGGVKRGDASSPGPSPRGGGVKRADASSPGPSPRGGEGKGGAPIATGPGRRPGPCRRDLRRLLRRLARPRRRLVPQGPRP